MLFEVDVLSMSSMIPLFDLRMSSSANSICYVETKNEFHFLLDLTYTVGIIYFLWAYDRSDIDLVQS